MYDPSSNTFSPDPLTNGQTFSAITTNEGSYNDELFNLNIASFFSTGTMSFCGKLASFSIIYNWAVTVRIKIKKL